VADAGIARVVVAVEDPNPLVEGRGIALLRKRGIEVTTGVLAAEARALNQPFFSLMLRGRPFVTMKVALSRDGRISEAPGTRTPLTGAAANRLIHRERAEVDALAVGSGTILADDPLLTARGAFRSRPLVRVVFDTRLRTPPGARLFSTLDAGPVIIMSTPAAAEAAPERLAALDAAGAEVVLVTAGGEGAPVPAGGNVALVAAVRLRIGMERLAARGISAIIVEGGATLHRALWDAGLIDRVQIFETQHQLGPGGVEWLPHLVSAAGLHDLTTTTLGDDRLIEGYVYRPD
jgi:diaminohydroxyphosphoribosylaminopyrimidine deaminase/5-amino-6-(5-phosphoribosylamino)uracil reductase